MMETCSEHNRDTCHCFTQPLFLVHSQFRPVIQ
uniref:Uncharacterized protein n=1 Tax=Anguilla anguilla TaxID=7936 RepID=A0A0E9R1R2_ANGAN